MKKRYNFESVPDEKLKTEILKTFEKLDMYQSGQPYVMALSNCESIRRNCIAKVAAEATGIHIGCTVLDISVFAGVACHAAAIIYQWTAGNNCNLEAENCSKSERRLETNTRINR